MTIILLSVLLGLNALLVFALFLLRKFSFVKLGPFFAQIQKLVMANNIDRAIKLCNAANCDASNYAKEQLTLSNKSAALRELRFAVLWRNLQDSTYPTKVPSWHHILGFINGVLTLVAIYFLVEAGPQVDYTTSVILFTALIATRGILAVQTLGMKGYYKELSTHLLDLRNYLHERSRYVPVHLVPRSYEELSEEQLTAWRDTLKAMSLDAERLDVDVDEHIEERAKDGADGLDPWEI